jgi:kynurenine formamidase
VLELATRVRNWGRWGADDEIGTLNLITPDVVRAAATEIRTGHRRSLALALDEAGPQTGRIVGRDNPTRRMLRINAASTGDPSEYCTSDDAVTMGLQAGTHWDALAHVSYDGRMYNGVPSSVVDERGARRLGIEKLPPIVGRGVLLDVARALGVDRLAPGTAITAEHLDHAVDLARLTVRAGDIVFVRTGQMQLFRAGDREAYGTPSPGLSLATVEWFRRHDVAAVATDNLTCEVYPCERADALLPVHLLHLVDMGLTQGQNFDLEGLSADCADDARYSFFVDASPLPFTGAVGAPVNPTVIF